MKEIGGNTHKDIVFFNDEPNWRKLVQRCKDLTRQDEKHRAAITDQELENFWSKRALPKHLVADEEALSKAMQDEIDKSGFSR